MTEVHLLLQHLDGAVADLLPPLTETTEGIRSDIIRRLPGW